MSVPETSPEGEKLSIWRALNRALGDALRDDPRVFLMGEDISTWGTGGGIYGVTRRLLEEFGEERVRSTPISEEVMVSAAVGAAMTGSRPIVEIMYSDFSLLAMDAIVNQAAKAHYMFGSQFTVPLVVRSNGGSQMGKAAQHSQSLETLFAHIPGLEVVVPATAGDAYGLLRSAIASPNPTIFLEHKALYNERDVVTFEPIPLGVARVVREGRDATVFATQLMLRPALAAADRLASRGIEIEVIDPRTLAPLDMDTILSSVEKTRRLLVLHEAPRSFGFGAEVVAEIAERLGPRLAVPPRRLCGENVPIAYAEALEKAAVPSTERIAKVLEEMITGN
jgi:pyruvate dehydrogenase E1 component beta subunit